MNTLLRLAVVSLVLTSSLSAQTIKKDIPYTDSGLDRHLLDIYAPAGVKDLPVVFWIHGGGWQAGDKSDVAEKPQLFMKQGFVFVSTNYRLLPTVDMKTLIGDCAKSLGWVHKHISEYGGDPDRIIVGGHSAGAQLAAILCTDDRYLNAEGVSFSSLKGCIPVDGDTYDIPKIIMTAEHRAMLYGQPLPTNGHRQKFGNDPLLHVDYSAVTHIRGEKEIPPFLILYVSGHPDTSVQAQRLANVLKEHDIPVTLYGGRNTTHSNLNNDLGLADDPATPVVLEFVTRVLK